MRSLTDAEIRVISALLGGHADSERERLRRMDVPRSTYHAARRRAYSEGWLRDRYVPDPVHLGLPSVSFLLVRPYLDRFADLRTRLASVPGSVVVWASSLATLAVVLQRAPREAALLSAAIEKDHLATVATQVIVEANGPTVPVYFDFEGLWSHLGEVEGTSSYPQGLGGLPAESDSDPTAPSSHQQWAIAELLHRPFLGQDGGGAGHLVGPFGLPYSQRRMLARGWVTHRVFLDPGRLPPYKGRGLDRVFFLHGAPKAGVRPEALFATLTRECRVFPFLYVVGSDRWLIGALGGSPTSGPPEDPKLPPRRPVLATLQQALEGIEIVQDVASNFEATVDHRYDRLLARRGV